MLFVFAFVCWLVVVLVFGLFWGGWVGVGGCLKQKMFTTILLDRMTVSIIAGCHCENMPWFVDVEPNTNEMIK